VFGASDLEVSMSLARIKRRGNAGRPRVVSGAVPLVDPEMHQS
jgi:hypothetical protein